MKLVLAAIVAAGIGYGIYSKNAAEAEEPKGKAASKTEQKKEEGWASEAAAKTKGLLASLGPEAEEPQPDAMVACQREDSTIYMHEGDCVNQGGRILFRKR